MYKIPLGLVTAVFGIGSVRDLRNFRLRTERDKNIPRHFYAFNCPVRYLLFKPDLFKQDSNIVTVLSGFRLFIRLDSDTTRITQRLEALRD